jgi:hypothetical protein
MEVKTVDVVTADDGAPVATGYMSITKGSFPWTLTYDEVQIVLEGELHLGGDAGGKVGYPGDVFYVPKGSSITFGTPSWAKLCTSRSLPIGRTRSDDRHRTDLRDQLRRPVMGAQVTVPTGARLSPSAADFVKQWALVMVDPDTAAQARPEATGGEPGEHHRDWDKASVFPVNLAASCPAAWSAGRR